MRFSYNDFARLYKINYLKRKSPKPKTFAESLRDISVFIETLKEIIKERQVNKIVSGLPKNMNGTLGPQGEKVIKFCELLEEETGIKIEYWDERLSTVAAERTLIQGNVRRENRKGVIDMVAAVIILQGYLDRQRNF